MTCSTQTWLCPPVWFPFSNGGLEYFLLAHLEQSLPPGPGRSAPESRGKSRWGPKVDSSPFTTRNIFCVSGQ